MARYARRLILWTTGILLSLALLAISAMAVLVWGINPDIFRARIERAATQALGRPVDLGALRWRPGLNFQFESTDGRITNAEGFGPAPLASWQALRLGVALRPLLDRRLQIDRVEFQGLRLALVRGARGINWTLPTSNPQSSSDLTVAVGSVALRDGAVSFTDEATGRSWSATALSLDAILPPRLEAPVLRFSGLSLQARLSGAPFDPSGVALQIELPRLDMDTGRRQLSMRDLQLNWNDATLRGALDADIGEQPGAEGTLTLQAPSLRLLLLSVSTPLPPTRDDGALGALEASARFAVGKGMARLTQLDVKLDSTQLAGEVKLPSLSPLSLRFELAADQVDLDRYLPPENAPGTPLNLPLAQLKSLDARGVLRIKRAVLAGAAARELRIDVE